MKSNDSWNYRVLIVDDQEEIHNDFEEMLASGSPKRATDELAAAFVAQSDKSVLPQFELSHAASGEEACTMVKAAQESNCRSRRLNASAVLSLDSTRTQHGPYRHVPRRVQRG